MEEAIQASADGFKVWRDVTPLDRQAIMEKAARLMEDRIDDIAKTLTLEMGKPFAEAKGEMSFVIDATRWYGEEGKRAYGDWCQRACRVRGKWSLRNPSAQPALSWLEFSGYQCDPQGCGGLSRRLFYVDQAK